MEMAKVTSKGQITIPISIRKRLKINEGDKLLFIDRPDGVMMVNPDLLGNQQETDISSNVNPTTTDRSTKRDKTAKKPSVDENEIYSETASKATKPSPVKTEVKSGAKVGNLNLDSLLDEIRSIGRNI